MSTLKVSAINNEAASSGGLAISPAGLVSGGGLDLIVRAEFTAQASVSLDDVFSSDYDNYRIVVSLDSSTAGYVRMRMRAAGSDDSSSNYNEQLLPAAGSATYEGRSASQTSIVALGNGGAAEAKWSTLEIFAPAVAVATRFFFSGGYGGVGSNISLQTAASAHNVATAYDGFTFYPDAGTISGSVTVYGYGKVA